jgi:hypothetical protein
MPRGVYIILISVWHGLADSVPAVFSGDVLFGFTVFQTLLKDLSGVLD